MRIAVLALVPLGISVNVLALGAQQLQLGAGTGAADHELLPSPILASAALTVGVTPWLGLRLGHGRGRDRFMSTGTTCYGLVLAPTECTDEPRRESASLTSWSIGLALSKELGGVDVRLLSALRRMRVESSQRGTESGRVREANKTAFGVEMGLEAWVALWGGSPLRLYGGVYGATHPWFDRVIVADGYTPFGETISMVWAEAGLALKVPR